MAKQKKYHCVLKTTNQHNQLLFVEGGAAYEKDQLIFGADVEGFKNLTVGTAYQFEAFNNAKHCWGTCICEVVTDDTANLRIDAITVTRDATEAAELDALLENAGISLSEIGDAAHTDSKDAYCEDLYYQWLTRKISSQRFVSLTCERLSQI